MTSFKQFMLVLVGAAAVASFAGSALASPYHVMVQSRQDAVAPTEVYVASFDTLDDVFSANLGAPNGFTQISVTPDYQIAGFTYDGSYRVMLQTRVDSSAPTEVYLASFDTLDDVFSANLGAPAGFSQIAISPAYQIVGFAYDGSYRLLLQTRQDAAAPAEVYLASFDTLDDVFSASIGAATGFTQISITPDYQIADFTYDGSYRLLVETRQDAAAPAEVYIASFDTLDDVFAANIGAPSGFSQISIAPDYRIVGFTGEWLPTPPVPEAGTFFLLSAGLACIVWVRRRKPA